MAIVCQHSQKGVWDGCESSLCRFPMTYETKTPNRWVSLSTERFPRMTYERDKQKKGK